MKRQYGLIGKTLKHSFSKNYFRDKFQNENIQDAQYELYELPTIESIEELIGSKNFHGLNVTIPYKQEVIPFLDELDQTAKSINAVNTILFKNGKRIGYNTDVTGFRESIKKLIGRKKVEKAMILGTGGASKAIYYVLQELGINPTLVSRTAGDITYEELNRRTIIDHRLIINCTPLGTYPNVNDAPPIEYKYLNKKHLLFDLVYNPEKTVFLNYGVEKACFTMNGLHMLIGQAEASWRIWNTK